MELSQEQLDVLAAAAEYGKADIEYRAATLARMDNQAAGTFRRELDTLDQRTIAITPLFVASRKLAESIAE